MKDKILVVDDDEDIRTQMKWTLKPDYDVVTAEDREGALGVFEEVRPDVVLLDLGLPPSPGDPDEGLAALSDLLGLDPLVRVVIISGQGDRQNAIEAVGRGAYDFLSKPVDVDELQVVLKRAFHVARLERQYRELQAQVRDDFEGMVGQGEAMRRVFSLIQKVAPSEAPVLILGESGTGKEMVARAIHRRSGRREGPFVAINCGALPDNLIESELFGHEKGSFTGAHAQRVGRVETAAGGTLFLDEIGELSMPLQVKLLRFLQEKTIERVGGREEIPIDARVVAATNVDLQEAMRSGGFREDLYYRLSVVSVELPALRERRDDILLLADSFVRRHAAESGRGAMRFQRSAVKAMEAFDWPGNVRQLENSVRRAMILTEGNQIGAEDLRLEDGGGSREGEPRTLKEAREAVERRMVADALDRHRGNVSAAASDLGVSRPTLYDLMGRFGMK